MGAILGAILRDQIRVTQSDYIFSFFFLVISSHIIEILPVVRGDRSIYFDVIPKLKIFYTLMHAKKSRRISNKSRFNDLCEL